MIFEVADTTLATDLGLKAKIYAGAGVPEYWVADVNARVIYQMWVPTGDSFGGRREVAFGDSITSITIAHVAIAAATL